MWTHEGNADDFGLLNSAYVRMSFYVCEWQPHRDFFLSISLQEQAQIAMWKFSGWLRESEQDGKVTNFVE